MARLIAEVLVGGAMLAIIIVIGLMVFMNWS